MGSKSSDSPTPASRPWGTWFIVAIAIVITAICAVVVWYEFVVTPETNCIIVVTGDKDLDGTRVEVQPKVAADPDRARLSATLSEANQYSPRFFLPSGTYTIHTQRPDGSPLVRDITEFVPPGHRWTYDLTRQKLGPGQASIPATQPASPR